MEEPGVVPAIWDRCSNRGALFVRLMVIINCAVLSYNDGAPQGRVSRPVIYSISSPMHMQSAELFVEPVARIVFPPILYYHRQDIRQGCEKSRRFL
ncbi:hypothetical protein AVEN_11716-1 [Araneus ventricosus]|uniref:Uncharacterized protein n=1 Tax=Araneus ventricosus TaxID=182803 RepID=A0A4Y2IGL8_ARAVE|nr:hypothetical protein AVEN_11716-1 [Araneus ventricosus]